MRFKYNTIGKSVRGASHIKKNLPNQDSIAIFEKGSEYNYFTYSIISDGHGSNKCFRSDRGSKFATEVLKEIFDNLIELFKDPNNNNLSYIKRYIDEKLAKEIVINWQNKVNENIELYPFVDKEIELLVGDINNENKRKEYLEKNKLLAYGATLLGVLATPKYILYVQLGDGDIIFLDNNNEVGFRLPKDEKLNGNETTSLCLDKAWNEFRIAFDIIDNQPPKAIQLSTDGLKDSYPNSDQDFFSFLTDSYNFLLEKGANFIEDNLRDWLQETTNDGSGDDISVAFIFSKKIESKNEPISIDEEPDDKSNNEITEEQNKIEEVVKNSNDKKHSFISFLALGISIISLFFSIYNFTILKDFTITKSKPLTKIELTKNVDTLDKKNQKIEKTDSIKQK